MTLNVMINDGEKDHRLTLFHMAKHILGYSKMSDVHENWGEVFEQERMEGRNRFLY